MDTSRFDALARFVAIRQSRRTALSAVFVTALLGRDPDAILAKHNGRGRVKDRTCYPGTRCSPGRGRNTSGCDFSNTTVFVAKVVRGSNLSNSNFTGADATGADFRGANLSGACFVDATLLKAKLGASVNLHQAIFCHTLMPDGSVNNAGCERASRCCATCSRAQTLCFIECTDDEGCDTANGEICIRGVCSAHCDGVSPCPPRVPTCCENLCVDTNSDPIYCGDCQISCDLSEESCVDGRCVHG